MKENKMGVDKVECFAWLSKTKCNALSKKECEKCSFYRHYTEVKGYSQYLPKDFKRKEVKNQDNC